MKRFNAYVILLLLATLTFYSQARTRQKSIENFIEDVRINNDGFANSEYESVTIKSTTQALEISHKMGYNVENELDILLFYQQSQNSDGGFGANRNETSTWESTLYAIRGLNYLNINQSHLQNWLIFEYLNSTASNLLYNSTEENSTTSIIKELNQETIKFWIQYITATINVGYNPTVPYLVLSDRLKEMQYPNGTYNSFYNAVYNNLLLNMIGEAPNQPELAMKYILAYLQDDGGFSKYHYGKSTIEDSYFAILALERLIAVENTNFRNDLINYILDLQLPNNGFHEVDQQIVTVESTWMAISILDSLEAISELLAPDILQTEGFISMNIMFPILSIVTVLYWRRK